MEPGNEVLGPEAYASAQASTVILLEISCFVRQIGTAITPLFVEASGHYFLILFRINYACYMRNLCVCLFELWLSFPQLLSSCSLLYKERFSLQSVVLLIIIYSSRHNGTCIRMSSSSSVQCSSGCCMVFTVCNYKRAFSAYTIN